MILRMDQAANERTDAIIAALLAMLRLMADGFIAAFGAPAAMLKSRPYGEPRQRILRWLNDMECVARRLLLLRATRFAPRPPEPTSEPRDDNSGPASAPREVADAFRGPNDDPETWRVDLRIDPPRDPVFAFEIPARPRAAPRRARPVLIYADCPRPLALRFEAILRVLDDPDGYAARLAHRLHRWRCRPARRQDFLRRLSRPAQIVNEAGLAESHWDFFAGARTLMLEMAPVFGYFETG
jgi:hypothetical protein